MKHMKELSEDLDQHDLKFLAKTPYVYHCHHFNLFHDQTVEDAVGFERGFDIKSRAAQDISRHFLLGLVRATGAATPTERLQVASTVFPWMGQGRLEVLAGAAGGTARGDHLHYSFAWREKYGSRHKRQFSIDAFAAGFAAAATEVAFSLEAGALAASEESCFVCREPACQFVLTPTTGSQTHERIDRDVVLGQISEPCEGQGESEIVKIAQGLKGFLLDIEGDARGLVQGFGIFITRHLSSYYDQTAYDTIHSIEKLHPQSVSAVEGLFGESGHVCVFYTFGNIILSPEWEAMVGEPKGEVEEIVGGCTAIARALGFGHWSIAELEPEKRLVLQSTSNYEAPFYLERYGKSDKPRCYFMANAARAFMQLAHTIDWKAQPELNDSLYQKLFRNELQWRVEETRCRCRGDEICEVVVTKR